MQCPHCHQQLFTRICTRCGGDTPAEGLYCMGCGAKLEDRPEEVIQDDRDFDLENRILCTDGTCTGIIINGKCIECGRTYTEDK